MMYKTIMGMLLLLAFKTNPVQAQTITQSLSQSLANAKLVKALVQMDGGSGSMNRAAVNHIQNLKSSSILVRLPDEKKRIAYMKSIGKTDQAIELESELEEGNDNMMDYFLNNFDYCNVYFYYSSDAAAIFKEKKFDLLWIDKENKATDLSFEKTPYVLMHGPVSYLRWNDQYKFRLHEWNGNKITYIESTAFPTIRLGKWKRRLRKLSQDIDLEKYSNLELQVAGLNATYHNIK